MIHSFSIVKPALLIGEINFLMNFPVLETLEFKDISESKKNSPTGGHAVCQFLQVWFEGTAGVA